MSLFVDIPLPAPYITIIMKDQKTKNTQHLERLTDSGINLSWLSRELGMERSTLYRYLNGTRTMPEDLPQRISQITGIEMEEKK